MKNLITETNREKLLNLLPILNQLNCKCNPGSHWRFFQLLAFSSYRDEETNAVRIGQESLARCENKMNLLKNNKYSAKPFLTHILDVFKEYVSLVIDDQGRDWSLSTFKKVNNQYVKTDDGKQRRVIVNFPDSVNSIINNELTTLTQIEEKVYIDSGLKRSEKREREEIKVLRTEVAQVIEIIDSPIAKYIASYLNKLPVNKFNSLADNYKFAESEIEKITNENSKRIQRLILNSIKERPIPTYVPTKNSDRLFTVGASMQNLKKSVRKALTAGWTEFDLSSAQLAIVAHQWNIDEVKQFLNNGNSLWRDLARYFNIDDTNYESFKSIVKDYVYGVVFGMGEEKLIEELNNELMKFNIINGGDLFLKHNIISALISARRRVSNELLRKKIIALPYSSKLSQKDINRINEMRDSGLIDDEGISMLVHDLTVKTKILTITKSNVLSVLAQVAQMTEQQLIYPAFELASSTTDFSITLYQYDGFSVSFSNSSRKEYWINRLTNAVNDKAKELGILTFLVHEENILPPIPIINSSIEVINNCSIQVRTINKELFINGNEKDIESSLENLKDKTFNTLVFNKDLKGVV